MNRYLTALAIAAAALVGCIENLPSSSTSDVDITVNTGSTEPTTTTEPTSPAPPASPNTLLFCDDVEPTPTSVPSSCFDDITVTVGTPRSFFVIAKDPFGVSIPSSGLDISIRTDTGGPTVLGFIGERDIQLRVDSIGTERQTTSATVRAAGTSRGLTITVIP